MPTRSVVFALTLLMLTVAVPWSWAGDPQPVNGAPPAISATPQALTEPTLPNAFRLSDQVISGGRPDNDRGFAALKALGVKTIISVDGARPDIERAERYGLRYVHLPHGYDGVAPDRQLELAKAVRDLPSPIYIHCHHGRHRSPAAAAIACIGVGAIKPSTALKFLEQAGTNPRYRGLFRSVSEAKRIDAGQLDALEVEFEQQVPLPPIAEAMVAMETSHDRLRQLADRQWESTRPRSQPDAAHEALLWEETMTELLRDPHVLRQPELFRQLLEDSRLAARNLRVALETDSADTAESTLAARHAALETVEQNCRTCHAQFRDVPLQERSTQ